MKGDALQRSTVESVFRMGVPSVILGVILLGAWRVVEAFGPDAHGFLRAAATQLDVMSENVPKMEGSLRSIAEDLPVLRQRLDSIEAKVDRALAVKEGR